MAKDTDFDKSDTGGYKPPAAREQIIDSLAKIPYQSSRHLCANTGASIDDVIEVVESDDEITFQMVGSIAVYFLRSNEPKGKLINSGDNSFIVKTDDADGRKNNQPPRRESKVSPELVEDCAFDGLDRDTAAERLGVAVSTFKNYLYSGKRPDLKAAWDNGKARRQEMIKSAKVETIKHSSVPVTESEDEAFKEIESKEISEPVGDVKCFPLSDELVDILEMDDEQFAEMYAQPSEQILEIPKQVIQHGNGNKTLERLYQTPTVPEIRIAVDEDLPRRPIEPPSFEYTISNVIVEPQNFRAVELSNGKKILMSSDINIFELKPNEAKFCAALVDLIDEFETARKS